MTYQEINEAVARKLGWDCCYRLDAVGWHRKLTPQGNHFHEPMPDYCHDIKAAWEVVEFIKPKGLGLCSHMMPPYGWSCSIWTSMTEEPDFTVRADTAPMAICLAFLELPCERTL